MKCKKCKNEVSLEKNFSIFFFLITGAIPYLIYYLVKSPKYCPICKEKN